MVRKIMHLLDCCPGSKTRQSRQNRADVFHFAANLNTNRSSNGLFPSLRTPWSGRSTSTPSLIQSLFRNHSVPFEAGTKVTHLHTTLLVSCFFHEIVVLFSFKYYRFLCGSGHSRAVAKEPTAWRPGLKQMNKQETTTFSTNEYMFELSSDGFHVLKELCWPNPHLTSSECFSLIQKSSGGSQRHKKLHPQFLFILDGNCLKSSFPKNQGNR